MSCLAECATKPNIGHREFEQIAFTKCIGTRISLFNVNNAKKKPKSRINTRPIAPHKVPRKKKNKEYHILLWLSFKMTVTTKEIKKEGKNRRNIHSD